MPELHEKIVHTLPFFILNDNDITMARQCLSSLVGNGRPSHLVTYNQGELSNELVAEFLDAFEMPYTIIGEGSNVGIPIARQRCFEHVWQHMPHVEYVSEIHLDMIFTPNWAEDIAQRLANTDEPMLSPAILTALGELHPEHRGKAIVQVPDDVEQLLELLPTFRRDELMEGFVHPVIHKNSILKTVGGYDTRFLTGMQGYEDDSLLLGYRHFMGGQTQWRPKADLNTWVFHATMKQRFQLNNIEAEMEKNGNGLIHQYGIYGLMELADIHQNPEFQAMAESVIAQMYRKVG